MTHLLLTIALTLTAQDVRPPARWVPPPKPVMTLAEVVVRGKKDRNLCGCATATISWNDSWSDIYGTYHGTELMSWVSSK